MDQVKEYDIKPVATSIINPHLKRRELKDKAADMVVGLDSSNIEEFNPQSSKGNRLLNKFYNRYQRKFETDKFVNTPVSEVLKWDPKKQERWFAAKKNQSAAPILGGIAAIGSLPWMLAGAVTSPAVTLLGTLGGYTGGEIGRYYGRKIDSRRHRLTNNELLGQTIGGVIGGSAGGFGGRLLDKNLISRSLNLPAINSKFNSTEFYKELKERTNNSSKSILNNSIRLNKPKKLGIGLQKRTFSNVTSGFTRKKDNLLEQYLTELNLGNELKAKKLGWKLDNMTKHPDLFSSTTERMSDQELVNKFMELSEAATRYRSIGNAQYKKLANDALQLIPELNNRGLTKNYHPSIDDITYNLVTEYDRFRNAASLAGSRGLKDLAERPTLTNSNIELADLLRNISEKNFSIAPNSPISIGQRTFKSITFPKTKVIHKRPLTSTIPRFVSSEDPINIREKILSQINIKDMPLNIKDDLVSFGDNNVKFTLRPTNHGFEISNLYVDDAFRKTTTLNDIFTQLGNISRNEKIPIYFNNRYTWYSDKGLNYKPGLGLMDRLMNNGIVGSGVLQNDLYDITPHFYLRAKGGKLWKK